MSEKDNVTLNPEERQQLLHLLKGANQSGRRIKRAHILLLADEGHLDETIAQRLYVGESTVHRTRQKFVEGHLEFALNERPRAGGKAKLDGAAEAFLVATACSTPPHGRGVWTMQMLADRLVGVIEAKLS